jgi:hypothetical protein
MKSVARVLALAALLLSAVSMPAAAAPIYYTLIGSTNPVFSAPPYNLGPVHEESFQLVAPDFISSYFSVTSSGTNMCVACAPAGTAIEFFPNAAFGFGRDQISFTDANGFIYGFFFDAGSFGAAGTYTAKDIPAGLAIGNIGTLTVSLTPPRVPGPPLPEPSSAVLIVAGVAAWRLRRAERNRLNGPERV